MLKKQVLIFLLLLSSWMMFAFNYISLGEISFQCPEDLDLDFDITTGSSYYNSFPENSKNRGNNRLSIGIFTYEEFVAYQKKMSRKMEKYSSYDEFKQNILKNNTWYSPDIPTATYIQKVYEKDGMIFATSYDFTSLWYVSDFGTYRIAVFDESKIYLFSLYFNKYSYNATDKVFNQMTEFVHLVFPGVKPGETGGEAYEGWMFNEGKNVYDLYDAIHGKKTGVKELDEYQEQFENLLSSIESNMMVKALENVEIKQKQDFNSNCFVTVKKDEKVKILSREWFYRDSVDGKSDSWFEVRVPKGTLDKDGNPIENDVTGYCFGGFLDK